MRIAIVGTRGIPANYGGFETFAEELSTRLVARGHRVPATKHADTVVAAACEYWRPGLDRHSSSRRNGNVHYSSGR